MRPVVLGVRGLDLLGGGVVDALILVPVGVEGFSSLAGSATEALGVGVGVGTGVGAGVKV